MERLKQVLEFAYADRAFDCYCLLGDPGIGKTQAIYELAERKGVKVVELIASQIVPTEISGMTMPDNDTHEMTVFDDVRLKSLEDGDILFLDELLQGSNQVLSACLTMIESRVFCRSGRKLPDVCIIAAANPLPSAAQIPLPIRQRFQFIDLSFSESMFRDYIKDKYGISVQRKLMNLVETRGDKYNVLTPRKFEKLLKSFIAQGFEDPDCRDRYDDWRLNVIRVYGNIDLPSWICEAFDAKRTGKQKLDAESAEMQMFKSALIDIAATASLSAAAEISSVVQERNWENTKIEELYEILSQLECWNEIEAGLSKMEVSNEIADFR